MFSNGCYMTIWGDGNNFGGNYVSKQVSTRKKNKETGEYETSFRTFVRFIGSAADVVRNLPEKSRIKVLECGVTSYYKKETNTTTFTFMVFKCEKVDGIEGDVRTNDAKVRKEVKPQRKIEAIQEGDTDDLPF